MEDDVSMALSKIKELKIDRLKNLSVHEERNLKVAKMQINLEEVHQRIRIINDLVFQAKLIALNASVEGTRSMESSHYFSIVSKEIQEMTNQFAHATVHLKKYHDQLKQNIQDFLGENDQTIEYLTNSSKARIEEVESTLEIVKKDSNVLLKNLNRIEILSFGSLELLKNQSSLMEEMQIISKGTHVFDEKKESA